MPPVRLKNTSYGHHRSAPQPIQPTITVADKKTEPAPEAPVEPQTLAPDTTSAE